MIKKIDTNESSLTGFCSMYKVEQDKSKKKDSGVKNYLFYREKGQLCWELR